MLKYLTYKNKCTFLSVNVLSWKCQLKMLFWCLWMDVGPPYPYCHRDTRQYCKSSMKHESRGLFISNTFEGGLIEIGGSFNLAKTLVSVVHKELECKAENLKYLK